LNLKKYFSMIIASVLISTVFFGLFSFDEELMFNVEGANLFVGGTGPGNFTTIQAAIDNASSGDTVYVWDGIYIENVIVNKTVTIMGNGSDTTVIDGSGTGDVVYVTADWVNITGFTINNSGGGGTWPDLDAGIELDSVEYANIYDVNSTGNNIGIYLKFSSNCTIEDNNCINNTGGSYNNGIRINGWASPAQDNTIQNNNCSLSSWGFFMENNANFNNINNNDVHNNIEGFRIISCFNNDITNNSCFSNDDYGIYLRLGGSQYNTIAYNTVINSTDGFSGYGIYLWSVSNNTVVNNHCSMNNQGIRINSGSFNTIMANNCTSNSVGINLTFSNNNSVYLNNLISNTEQAFDDSTNNWNAIYPLGGNYWNDYIGLDEKSGSAQDQLGMDSFGDTPYYVHWGKQDSYPLMHMYYWWTQVSPEVELLTPLNNSVLLPGTILYFNVWDGNLDLNTSTFSVNGSGYQPFIINYQNDTSAAGDDVYNVKVNAMDNMVNTVVRSFNFTIDSTDPMVILNLPPNNSTIGPGAVIDLKVVEPNLIIVNFTINGGANQTLSSPYDISSSGWNDGINLIEVYAEDAIGHWTIELYNFTLDLTKPMISLLSPANNSAIVPGTNISLNVTDTNLANVNYSINGGINLSLSVPYNISTTGWLDGIYRVDVYANDTVDNEAAEWNIFIIDSEDPIISLNSPINDSIIFSGTIIDLNITDNNTNTVNYSINGGTETLLISPYDIDTNGWVEGVYTIVVQASDMAAHTSMEVYVFTVDTGAPMIALASPGNNTFISAGTNISLDIADINLNFSNYSLNFGIIQQLTFPFNITTTGWVDGNYIITVNAVDLLNQSSSKWFNFTLDSTKPEIDLISPANNSMVSAGVIIDFEITEENIFSVEYSVDNGGKNLFIEPYDLSSTFWEDGLHNITVYVLDLAWNSATTTYSLEFDSTAPVVDIISPLNNSFITKGTIIEFSITELNLANINYTINAGNPQQFSTQFEINTSSWVDGNYIVEIQASDLVDNIALKKWFNFTIDSTDPLIILNSPANNAIFRAGLDIDFDIIDNNTEIVNYSYGVIAPTLLNSPYNISTVGWLDGIYLVTINAMDKAGNTANADYTFTIDNKKPVIAVMSPEPEVLKFSNGTIIELNITDVNLDSTNYSINYGTPQVFAVQYEIDTTELSPGSYILIINASDKAGNTAKLEYIFEIIEIITHKAPKVNSIKPVADASDIALDTSVEIEFDMEMNIGSVELALNITPSMNISALNWNIDNTKLTIVLAFPLAGGTKYTITISKDAKSSDSVALEQLYSWSFTTDTDNDNDGIGDILDDDDDNDGYKDSWEEFLETDPNDPEDTPVDTDGDLYPNGDDSNTLSWMDPDDDNDGATDAEEIAAKTDPLDPKSKPDAEDGDGDGPDDDDKGILGWGKTIGIDNLLFLIIFLLILILIIYFAMRKTEEEDKEAIKEKEELEEDEEEEKMFECPECGSMVPEEATSCPECGAEFEEEEFECPDCGAEISPDTTKCPECGAEFVDEDEDVNGDETDEDEEVDEEEEVEEEVEEEEPEEEELEEEEPEEEEPEQKEIEEVQEEEAKVVVDSKDSDVEKGDEGEFECPDCGATIVHDASTCPACGTEFEDDQ